VKVLFGLTDAKSPNPHDSHLPQKHELTMDQIAIGDPSLNDFQKIAVKSCVNAPNVSLIHGPPGTGKTKTVIEIIRQLASSGNRMLVSAASNMAVDNLIERLIKFDSKIKLVRIGQPGRMLKCVQEYCLDFYVAQAAKKDPELKDLKRSIKKLNDQKSKKLKGRVDKKIHLEVKAINSEIKGLKFELRHLGNQIKNNILRGAQIVVATQSSVYDKKLENFLLGGKIDKSLKGIQKLKRIELFDYAIIDEAAQALEVSSWMPI
jgi:superfamily I DNA and/or RNA helicase